MNDTPYRFLLEVSPENTNTAKGEALRVPLPVDWEPAREWLRFQAWQDGVESGAWSDNATSFVPRWHELGQPYLAGFELTSTCAPEPFSCTFDNGYFEQQVNRTWKQLLEEGKLRAGERYRFLIACLHQAPRRAQVAAHDALIAHDVTPPLELRRSSIAAFEQGARRHRREGESSHEGPEVFIAGTVMEEARSLTLRVSGKETGGVLLGHLHRDETSGRIFSEVTAQVLARHTRAGVTRLTFTPDSWTDVRATIDLRGQGELMLGWWHSHPVRAWCSECPTDRQERCTLGQGFLSAHDKTLHRTLFPRAFAVALVVNDVATGPPTCSLFGWNLGILEQRDYFEMTGDAK